MQTPVIVFIDKVSASDWTCDCGREVHENEEYFTREYFHDMNLAVASDVYDVCLQCKEDEAVLLP